MTTTSPPPLQVLGESAAAAWLVQWSDVVGLVAVRRARQRLPRNTPMPGSTTPTPTAVPGPQSAAREGTSSSYRHTRSCVVSSGKTTAPTHGQAGRVCPAWPGVPETLDAATVAMNVSSCSCYLDTHLPPLLRPCVLNTAWSIASQETTLGGQRDSLADQQVAKWARRTPVLLGVAATLTSAKYPMDLTGLPQEALQDVLQHVERHFPVERLSSVLLPSRKATHSSGTSVAAQSVLTRLLQRTTLVSLGLNTEVVDEAGVEVLCQLSLQELEISGAWRDEAQLLRGLCGLPLTGLQQVVEAVRSGTLSSLPVAPLRHSLRRLSLSLSGLPSAAYPVLLAVFPNLRHYSPPCSLNYCLREYARMTAHQDAAKLGLLSLRLSRASAQDIREATQLCPSLRDISISIELDCESCLAALLPCEHLSSLSITYYPASNIAQPRVEGGVLLPLLHALSSRLLSLDLSGFKLGGGVVAALAVLPELRRLSLTDCWLARPPAPPRHPFPALDFLALSYLPPPDILALLTAGSCLHTLKVSGAASEGPWAVLTDEVVKRLVASGVLASLHTFSSSSPFLTMASLRLLSSLPRLRAVASLASWSLSPEELRCLPHSAPMHLLCQH